MYFQYTALNPENQKLSGTIQAADEKEARARLNELALSIIEIKPLAEAVSIPKPTQGKRFFFEAIDRKGKKVVGTIDATSDGEAFEKLATEYLLNVTALFEENVSETAKQEALERLEILKTDFEKKQEKKGKETALTRESVEKERKELLQKVDLTIETINAFLNEYGNDMKSEERENIRGYINQLFRIKDSTNLKHIQQTCEKMLSYIEKREVFLQETRRHREQATLKVESHELLEELKKTGLKKEISVFEILRSLVKIPVLGKFLQKRLEFFLIDDPRAMELRKNIKALGARIWEFRKLAFKSKDPAYKYEVQETLHQLIEEKKRRIFELKGLQLQKKLEWIEARNALRLKNFGNGSLLVGWLLAFYLIFYFLTFPFTIKDFGLSTEMPGIFSFYRVPFLKGLLMLLFLLHVSFILREEFFSKKTWSPFVLYPVFGLLYLFFLFNFVI